MPQNPYGIDYSTLQGMFNRAQQQRQPRLPQRPPAAPETRGLESPLTSGDLRSDLLDPLRQEQDDLERTIAMAEAFGSPPETVAGLKPKMAELSRFFAPDLEQEAEVTANRGAMRTAALEGFGSPQEQAAYGREFEEEKMRVPLERQFAQEHGRIDAARIAAEAKLHALEEMLRSEVAQNRGVSVSGVGAVGPPPRPQPSQAKLTPSEQTNLGKAFQAYRQNTTLGPDFLSGMLPRSGAAENLETIQSFVLSNKGVPPDAIEMGRELVRANPGATVQQLIEGMKQLKPEINEADLPGLQFLFTVLMGQ